MRVKGENCHHYVVKAKESTEKRVGGGGLDVKE